MKFPIPIALTCLLAAGALIGCNFSTGIGHHADGTADFYLGEWHRSEDAGQGLVMHRTWTFRPDGTLEESGYPAWHATARYTIAASTTTTATLRLAGKSGEQGDSLPDELTLVHDTARNTLTVNGAGPFMPERRTPSGSGPSAEKPE